MRCGGRCVPADVQTVLADKRRACLDFAEEDVSFQTVCEAVPAHKMHHARGQSGLLLTLANHGRLEAFVLLNSATWESKPMRRLALLDDEHAPIAVEDRRE